MIADVPPDYTYTGNPIPKRARKWKKKNRMPSVKVKVYLGDGEGRSYTASGYGIYIRGKNKRMSYLHEMGHQVDYQLLSDKDRKKFQRIIRNKKRPWRAEGGNSPHEKFAEAYRVCGAGLKKGERFAKGGYNHQLSKKKHRKVCRIIRKKKR